MQVETKNYGELDFVSFNGADFGAIPSNWSAPPLFELTNLILSGAYFESKHTPKDVPTVRIADIQSSVVNLDVLKQFSDKGCKDWSHQNRPSRGDVLLSTIGTVGIPIVVDWNYEFSITSTLTLIRPKSELLSKWYLYYFIESDFFKEQMYRRAKPGTIKYLPQAEIREFLVPLPATMNEQMAIASILNEADEMIKALDRLITKKRLIMQGVMHEFLAGKRRLPGFSGKWKEKSLGEIGIFLKGSGVKKDEANSGPFPCICYGEIYTTHHSIVREFHSFISSGIAKSATALKCGDILFAGSGETKKEIGKCAAFVDKDMQAYAGGDIIILRPTNADHVFLGYLLNSEPIQAAKSSKGQGDAVVHISAKELSSIEVKIPKIDEQRAISYVLLNLDEELLTLESTRAKVGQIKNGMIQELLTGRVRLV